MNILTELRIDFNKNTKLTYYITNIVKSFVPKYYYKRKLKHLLESTAFDDEKKHII